MEKLQYKTRFLVFLILLVMLFSSCLPTPNHEAIVAPSGYEAKILDKHAKKGIISQIPDYWQEKVPLQYWDISIAATVSPSELCDMPVYESSFVSMEEIQDQVNMVKRVLLKDATAYSEDVLTKADWYRQIQLFSDTPAWDDETGAYTRYRDEEEIQSYVESLSSFIESAPDELIYNHFSPTTDNIPDNANYMLTDGSLAWMSCNSNSLSIRYGADIFVNAIEQPESWVLEGDAVLGEPIGSRIIGVKIDEKDAENKALSLMSDLSLGGFKIARIEKARYINDYTHDIISVGYQMVFCRAEGQYEVAYNTISTKIVDQEDDLEDIKYRPNWFQEQIYIYVDETGIRSFYWIDPTSLPQLVNESVEILTFEEIQAAIKRHLKNCFSWEEDNDLFRAWYSGRSKYLVDHIGLYFGMIPKKNDVNSFYYGPVWIVTVRSYPADIDTPTLSYTMYTQYLHINAIDGSLIKY